jgi:hypothetical protein
VICQYVRDVARMMYSLARLLIHALNYSVVSPIALGSSVPRDRHRVPKEEQYRASGGLQRRQGELFSNCATPFERAPDAPEEAGAGLACQ